ncbi:hypothetical protein I317_02546 [Kwoniella heveanensis CBS 569]|uniref:Uncharacterized protein n=1 Tax=Kwoniella heveanensis BCC8398 TaxID=1296120 RepID=A0A1B9GIB6_9TREE|nr:hypothetical protein I316_07609 [Kwoniella heveanensis BCC8398]OCF43654.1 hypothetical protein I317_02546 [Kwoniella heveanensis CBS 569]
MTASSDSHDLPKPPEPLDQPIRLIVALASLSATLHPKTPVSTLSVPWYKTTSSQWLKSVCKLLSFDQGRLPTSIDVESVKRSADEQRDEWSEDEILRIAGVLIEASLAADDTDIKKKKDEEGALKYTPIARALSYRTLELLGLPARELVPQAEKNLSNTLFHALKAAAEKENQEKVEKARAAQSQGWGGSLGRHLATGAGVVAGGVLIGVTGGLAAPAIAAVLAPLGIGGILSASAAPVVLGTLFGVGGGGLAGRRVRERWKGVEEFSFIEVGDGHRATQEELDDLQEAKKRAKAKQDEEAKKKQEEAAGGKAASLTHDEKVMVDEAALGQGEVEQDRDAEKAVQEGRLDLEQRLLNLSLESGTRAMSTTVGNSPRVSLDQAKEEKALTETKKPPSLTATIVVPGLLTVSRTEAITAWRAICSTKTSATSSATIAPNVVPREKAGGQAVSATVPSESGTDALNTMTGLKDGRDVYLLRFESAAMLKTGRDVDLWVESKLKGLLKKEIIKRTVLSAYFAAVSLPLSVYSMATMTLDNTWMHAQDRAKKAGRLLGEVIEKRVQGERPVVLIGSSVGALTILHALLYLASLPPPPPGSKPAPTYVESAYMISLPAAPSTEEWSKCRSVVSRRLVNAWSDADLVLAGVVRLHEVVSRAAVMSNGIKVAGLGPVEHPELGVEDVDVSSVLRGHMELQAKMPEVLRIIDIDA